MYLCYISLNIYLFVLIDLQQHRIVVPSKPTIQKPVNNSNNLNNRKIKQSFK